MKNLYFDGKMSGLRKKYVWNKFENGCLLRKT